MDSLQRDNAPGPSSGQNEQQNYIVSVTLENPDRTNIDPIFVINYPSFKIAPLVVPVNSDDNVISYTMIEDTQPTNSASGSSRPESSKQPKKRLRRNEPLYTRTSLSKCAKHDNTNSDTQELVLYCEWDDCDECFEELSDFMKHVGEHIEQELPTIQKEEDDRLRDDDGYGCLWQDCLFVSDNREDVIRHAHFHTFHTHLKFLGADVLKKAKINPCKMDNSQRNIVPELSEPFRCLWNGCNKFDSDFPEAIKFYYHVAWHSQEFRDKTTEIQCQWRGCNSKPGTMSKLKEHLRTHSQERVVGCPICGGLFANRSKFFDHCKRQAPSYELHFKCSYCNKQFALERLLRDHMRQHINSYKCNFCDMTSPTPSALASHVTYKHSTTKNFPCDEPGCTYKAKTNSDLLIHIKVHTGENSFFCSAPDCTYKCKNKTSLKHHTDAVHNQMPSRYCCHLCTVRFKRGRYLTKHLLKIHRVPMPSGHSRFRYREDEDGFFHLQTIRFESTELGGGPGAGSNLGMIDDDEDEDEEDVDDDLEEIVDSSECEVNSENLKIVEDELF